jgi:molybdenum cofactor synthesis domain-containing protein
MRIANIIATGSEVTSGQIVNSNAAWISQKLLEYNFEIPRHIAIDDNTDRILETLMQTHQSADLVIVTGGLGPTTDDLTRQIVADWSGLPLKFDESEWERIQSRLKALDVEPRQGHKWQAYFPEGSEVFTNNAGTASGFSVQVQKDSRSTLFWFLPGPPNEIKKIWQDHLEQKLARIGPLKTSQLKSWQFIDLAESELAHIVEPLLEPLGFAVGYRASPPLVELKVWVPDHIKLEEISVFKNIESLLKDHIHYQDFADPMLAFFRQNSKPEIFESIYIQDEITEGELLNRIEGLKSLNLKDIKVPKVFYANLAMLEPKFPHLKLFQTAEDSFWFEYKPTQNICFKEQVVFKRKVSSLRQKKWVCEMLFKRLSLLNA